MDPRMDSSNDAPFTITILDDEIEEPTEYLEIHFTVETTGFAFPDAIARVTILDDDARKKGGSPQVGMRFTSNTKNFLDKKTTQTTMLLHRFHI